jgi:hypothetical protein
MPRVSNERAGTPPPLQLPLTRRDRRGTAGDRIRLGAEMKMQQGTGKGRGSPPRALAHCSWAVFATRPCVPSYRWQVCSLPPAEMIRAGLADCGQIHQTHSIYLGLVCPSHGLGDMGTNATLWSSTYCAVTNHSPFVSDPRASSLLPASLEAQQADISFQPLPSLTEGGMERGVGRVRSFR